MLSKVVVVMSLNLSWAKNVTRKVLWAALEKDISKKDRTRMATFFNQRCVYCDEPLPNRWHADHLKNIDQGGMNHISNRVPSCPKCNEAEKMDQDWRSYIQHKHKVAPRMRLQLIKTIENWISSNKPKKLPVSALERKVWATEVELIEDHIEKAYKKLTKLRSSTA